MRCPSLLLAHASFAAAQILGGVAYLHERRITHRDLKLENLLLGDKNDLSSVRIADFGLAHAPLHPEDTSLMSLVCGTPMCVRYVRRTETRAARAEPYMKVAASDATLQVCRTGDCDR